MNEKKKNVIKIFISTIIIAFFIEVFSPELQQAGLSERVVDGLAAGISSGGLIFLSLNIPKIKS